MRILAALFMLALLPSTVLALDNDFILGINLPISGDDEALNVNVRNPSNVQGLSLQDATTIEFGYQFNISPRFGTDVSLVNRLSNIGSDNSSNIIETINELIDSIECLFSSSDTCDDDSQNFNRASYAPYGIQVIPFYNTGKLHLGAGIVHYGSDDIEVKYENDNIVEKIAMDSTTGAVVKASYFFSRCCSFAFTYENISFDAKTSITDTQGNAVTEIDGSNLAIGFKARF